jgi:hypothetical protein
VMDALSQLYTSLGRTSAALWPEDDLAACQTRGTAGPVTVSN